MRAADAYCQRDDAGWLKNSKLGVRIVHEASTSCQQQGDSMSSACNALLSSGQGPVPSALASCVTRHEELPPPQYWAYNYSRDAGWLALHPCAPHRKRMVSQEDGFRRANSGTWTDPDMDAGTLTDIQQSHGCPSDARIQLRDRTASDTLPPSTTPVTPATPATPATPTPAPPWKVERDICKGVTIYVQIYGPEDRNAVRSLRDWWRLWQASVPPIEDVYDSARRTGRGNPAPVQRTVLRYHDPAAEICARAISAVVKSTSDGATAWGPEALSRSLKASPGVIELWVRPKDPWLGKIQAAVTAG